MTPRSVLSRTGHVVKVRAPAKINIFLLVSGPDGRGYHRITTLFQSVSLYDEMYFTLAEGSSVSCESSEPELSGSSDNLALRAALLLKKTAMCRKGARILIKKRIPVGGGLGGGSSDAAAALLGLNKLWNLRLSPDKLSEIGLKLGSDVPFFVRGGLAYAEGRGEILTYLPQFRQWYLLIFLPFRSPTEKVYREYDRILLTKKLHSNTINTYIKSNILLKNKNKITQFIRRRITDIMVNELEDAFFSLYPDAAVIKKRLSMCGIKKCILCGSGSSFAVPLADRKQGILLRKAVSELGYDSAVVSSCRAVKVKYGAHIRSTAPALMGFTHYSS